MRKLLCILALCSSFRMVAQDMPVLDRRVDVDARQLTLDRALEVLAREGNFKLSYNADAVPTDSLVDLRAEQARVRDVLEDLLPGDIVVRSNGDHVILAVDPLTRERHVITGRVLDAGTRMVLANATVVALQRGSATGTDGQGSFTLKLKGVVEGAPLLVGRTGYRDTVVYLGMRTSDLQLMLTPLSRLEKVEPLCVYERCGVEDLGVAKLLVPASSFEQSGNVELGREVPIQFSLWPGMSTNGDAGGALVNQLSFNLLGGYARGVNGLEMGVGVNIDAWHVKGAQFAGVANLVGGRVNGFQFAGGVNHAMRSLQGVQLAGLGNVVWDTLAGVQIAGGANVAKGDMRGTQVAGGVNVALSDIDGAQVAGGANVAVGDVRKAQVAGGLNYGRNVTGAQFAFGANVALGSVGGGQVGFGLNYARDVTGGQVTFGLNVASGTVRGGQVGAVNFAMRCEGAQVGIVNFSDTISGTSFGILSIARRGYHRAELFATDVHPLNLQVRTGTSGFHNILGYSPPVEPNGTWAFRYGFGVEPRIGKGGFLNVELTGEHVNEQAAWVNAVNIVGRFGLFYGRYIGKHLTLSAGASLNDLFSDWTDPETGEFLSTLAPSNTLWDQVDGEVRQQAWIGWRVAAGVRF